MRKFISISLSVVLLSACAGGPLKSMGMKESKAQHMLAIGLEDYEDGKFSDAMRSIQGALDLGLEPVDQIRAHKHLAFIQCVSGREKLCREEFRKTLEVNPWFDLSPAEAGHPVWGPVFRSVKAKKTDLKK